MTETSQKKCPTFPTWAKIRPLKLTYLHDICEEKGITVRELCEAIGISKDLLYQYDKNQPHIRGAQNVEYLAKVLEVEVKELVSYEDLSNYASESNRTYISRMLEEIRQQEKDGYFPPEQKIRGLKLPGLKQAMEETGVGARELATAVGVNTKTIYRYMNCERGVKGIENYLKIVSCLEQLSSK